MLEHLRRAVPSAALALTFAMGVCSSAVGIRDRTVQTLEFQALPQREVARPPGRPPPLNEDFVAAARASLAPGESWELIMPNGRCLGPDGGPPGNNSPRITYAGPHFWLGFRLLPNPVDCTDPDVLLYWNVPPPEASTVVARGRRFAVVRP